MCRPIYPPNCCCCHHHHPITTHYHHPLLATAVFFQTRLLPSSLPSHRANIPDDGLLAATSRLYLEYRRVGSLPRLLAIFALYFSRPQLPALLPFAHWSPYCHRHHRHVRRITTILHPSPERTIVLRPPPLPPPLTVASTKNATASTECATLAPSLTPDSMRSASDPLDERDPQLSEDGCAAYVGCQRAVR